MDGSFALGKGIVRRAGQSAAKAAFSSAECLMMLAGGKARDSGGFDENIMEKHSIEMTAPQQPDKGNRSGRTEAEAAQTPPEG